MVVKNLFEAYTALDVDKLESFISKNFEFQTFPKVARMPDEAKGKHLEWCGPLFSLISKVEVYNRNCLRVHRLTYIIPK